MSTKRQMEEKRFEQRRKQSGRRVSDDQTASVPAPSDRRETPRPGDIPRRAHPERRLPVDRRVAPESFDSETSSNVQEIVMKTGVLVRCPQCNEQLTLGPVIHKAVGSHREVRCTRCRKNVIIENLP